MEPQAQPTQVYLAGPLFTQGEREFNLNLATHIEHSGYRVFLPQQECAGLDGEAIYQTCLAGLKAATLVVAILDGADADSGTCWECGYATSQQIPIVAVRTDFRMSGDTDGFNAMLYYSATQTITGTDVVEQVVAAVRSIATRSN